MYALVSLPLTGSNEYPRFYVTNNSSNTQREPVHTYPCLSFDWVSAFGYFMEFQDANFSLHQQILLRTHSSTLRWRSGHYCSCKAGFHRWHRRNAIQSSSPEYMVPSALSSLHIMARNGKTEKKIHTKINSYSSAIR